MSSSSSGNDDLEENESSRVLGIGAGTFTVAFMFFITVLVWILTAPQAGLLKNMMRITTIVLFLSVFAILLFADRDSQYKNQEEEVKDYDDSLGPRIAISVLMIFSTLLSGMMVFFNHWTIPFNASSQDLDNSALWQE
mmetsp:Transcript_2550/g.3896  ORF Transcript_2550/g.3896 Transcript_2550/m.3896 type:complete len:138 (-) Transcript_2550:151-564(-)